MLSYTIVPKEGKNKMKTFIISKRLIKQILGDKRSIGLMFVAPVFVIFLLSIILTSSASKPNIDIVSAEDSFIEILKKEATVNKVNNEDIAIEHIKDKKSDAYIKFEGNNPIITVEGADPSITKLVMTTMNKVLSENMTTTLKTLSTMVKSPKPIAIPEKLEVRFYYGSKDMGIFDSIAPLMMGFFIFFFVFLIAGVAFLRERISGTLDRILATPLKRSEIVWGYFCGFGLFIALQTIVIQTFMVYGINVHMAGSFWVVLVINLVLAGGSLALGTLLSAFASNEFQLFQFIPLVIVPQILFCGVFDLREAPIWVTILSKIFPMTYGAEALRNVMIRGYGFSEVYKDILILLFYALIFIMLNSLALKKYRRI